MIINERTKIAALIKHHPDALETIVTLSPDFKKLRNPILRALMAGRTTISMASKIGGCKPEDFFEALAPLGFQVDRQPLDQEQPQTKDSQPKPEYLKRISADQIVNFDVREMLATGVDPLKAIQKKVKALASGEVLLIINNFEPVPLIKLLEKQGFSSYINFVDEDTIETYFYKENSDETPQVQLEASEEEIIASSGDWDMLLERYKNNLVDIDVRALEMPMPMMTILESLEQLPAGKALYVHHKRIPVFLLTELKERTFEYRIKKVSDTEVFLLIFKK